MRRYRRGTALLSLVRQVLVEQLDGQRIHRKATALGFLAKSVLELGSERKLKHHNDDSSRRLSSWPMETVPCI